MTSQNPLELFLLCCDQLLFCKLNLFIRTFIYVLTFTYMADGSIMTYFNDLYIMIVHQKYQQPRSRPQSSRASSSQTSRSEYQRTRARSASPASSRPTTTKSQLTTIGSRSNTRSSFRSSVSAQSQHQQVCLAFSVHQQQLCL